MRRLQSTFGLEHHIKEIALVAESAVIVREVFGGGFVPFVGVVEFDLRIYYGVYVQRFQ